MEYLNLGRREAEGCREEGIHMGEVLLKAQGICKAYSGITVLDHVELTVRKGEVHALLGENGAGKSTLMKILTGIVKQDEGSIIYRGEPLWIHHPQEIQKYGIGIVYQEFNLLPDLTVAENIFIGREPESRFRGFINDRKMNRQAEEILEQLHCRMDPTQKVSTLSVAQQQMVEIAKALSYQCELLIMDEPTAALTEHEIQVLFSIIRQLREEGVAIIYISHRMSDLDAIVDTVSVLRDGHFIAKHRYKPELKDQLIKEMVGRDLVQKYPPRPAYTRGECTLRVQDLCTHKRLKHISFEAYQGEILGIAGLMGAGRTELARALFGADPIEKGEIQLYGKKQVIHSPSQAIRMGFGYVTEDRKRDGLMLEQSLKENILLSSYERFSRLGMIQDGMADKEADSFIEMLRIRAAGRSQRVGRLSGGNQQKAVIAKWLCRRSRVLLLDEPTRGIDVGAKYEIYEWMYRLAEDGATILMISSELPEILGMSDRILVMSGGRITAELDAGEADQNKILKYAMSQ